MEERKNLDMEERMGTLLGRMVLLPGSGGLAGGFPDVWARVKGLEAT